MTIAAIVAASSIEELHDFFVASVSAAAALLGLLFVAVSLGPESLFGAEADQKNRGAAVGAFVAFANVLFVSFAMIVPRVGLYIVIVVAFIALAQILIESRALGWSAERLQGRRPFGLLSIVIYSFEAVVGVRLILHSGSPDAIVYIVLGLYGYALNTSWSLLRNRGRGPAKRP
jgi:hypothetical protein